MNGFLENNKVFENFDVRGRIQTFLSQYVRPEIRMLITSVLKFGDICHSTLIIGRPLSL